MKKNDGYLPAVILGVVGISCSLAANNERKKQMYITEKIKSNDRMLKKLHSKQHNVLRLEDW